MSPHRSPSRRDERPPAPDPLPIPVVDNHVHLDIAREGEDAPSPAEAVAAASAVGVDRLVQVGCDPAGVRFTMVEPWTALLLDDAQVVHETTPIQKAGPHGVRDTLVLTFRADSFQAP